MFNNIIEDLDVYAYSSKIPRWGLLSVIFIYPVTWPIIVYRFGSWVKQKCNVMIVKQVLFTIYFINKRIVELMTGVEIADTAVIGRGLCIKHLGNVVIGHKTKIGEHCTIVNNVTIGEDGRNEYDAMPVIGNYVYIGSGAAIIGKISIGDNVLIGANAAVVKSLPDNSVAVGVPAKAIRSISRRDFIFYRNKN